MINRKLTDEYIKHFDTLAEAIYLCWHNSFCYKTKQLDEVKLREQIRSYGFCCHKNAIRKDLPLTFRNKLKFKTLLWVNTFTDSIAEDSVCECTEFNKKVIKEIENNLFSLTDKTAKTAYANIILRDIDKNYIHNQKLDNSLRDFRYKEMFQYLLDHNFIAEDNVTTLNDHSNKIYPIYDLTIRLINHFDFIERLIDLFSCFDINLILVSEKAGYNLYIFNEKKFEWTENKSLEQDITPKFNSHLSDDCLIKIMHYLNNKKKLENPNSDLWLFWFNRKCIKVPESLIWKGTPSMLSNVIQHLCGESISNTIKTAFGTKEYVKPTRKEYETGKTYKEIEQIITISKQKNN